MSKRFITALGTAALVSSAFAVPATATELVSRTAPGVGCHFALSETDRTDIPELDRSTWIEIINKQSETGGDYFELEVYLIKMYANALIQQQLLLEAEVIPDSPEDLLEIISFEEIQRIGSKFLLDDTQGQFLTQTLQALGECFSDSPTSPNEVVSTPSNVDALTKVTAEHCEFQYTPIQQVIDQALLVEFETDEFGNNRRNKERSVNPTSILNGWRTKIQSKEIVEKLEFAKARWEEQPNSPHKAFALDFVENLKSGHEACLNGGNTQTPPVDTTPAPPADTKPGDTKPAGDNQSSEGSLKGDNQSSEGSLKGDNMWLIIFGAIAAIIAAVAGFTAPMWMPR